MAAIRANSIADVDLSSIHLCDAQLAPLCDAIKQSTSILRLFLENNQISEAGATIVAEACEVNASLIEVELHDNPCFEASTAHVSESDRYRSEAYDLLAEEQVRSASSSTELLLLCYQAPDDVDASSGVAAATANTCVQAFSDVPSAAELGPSSSTAGLSASMLRIFDAVRVRLVFSALALLFLCSTLCCCMDFVCDAIAISLRSV